MGVADAMHDAGKAVRIIAAEPDESAVMSGDQRGCHGIQGLADGFIPDLIDMSHIDQVYRIRTSEAAARARLLSRQEGLLVGISSGANILGATRIAEAMGPGHSIVTILPDRGERYLSIK